MPAHPRLSVSAMSSVRWSFDEDLTLWRDLGLGWAGLIGAKLGDGTEAGIAALADAGIRVSTVIVPRFDLGAPASWAATHAAHRRWIDAVAKHDGWSLYFTPASRTPATPARSSLSWSARSATARAMSRSSGAASPPPRRRWPKPDYSDQPTKGEPDGPDEQGTGHAR
jgi:hypothetical protein